MAYAFVCTSSERVEGSIDGSSECEIEDPSLNSNQFRYINLRAKTAGKCINPSPPLTMD